jgi:acetoin utilization deacetylase AcuC-like enzyme
LSRIAYSTVYNHPLPAGHRFPMLKYDLIYEQLIYESSFKESDFFTPVEAPHENLLLTHSEAYLSKLDEGKLSRHEERATGFPYSKELVYREKVIMQGTIDAAFIALKHGYGANIAGGTHHAYADSGEGFCLLNDMAIAANVLLHENKSKQILIVDLDVHQGNGTAKIFENEPRVFTMSMHGKNNFPLHKEKSDLDIELSDGTDDKTFLSLLNQHLKATLDQVQPDFVFYLCGVDVLKTDKLGRLGMTIQGCKERDKMVFTECKRASVPITIALGGGYSEDIRHIVDAHSNTFRLMADILG